MMIVNMNSSIILIAALVYVFLNGLTDAPTILAQIISTRSLGPRRSLLLIAVLEFAGAAFFSGMVLKTMSFASLQGSLTSDFQGVTQIPVFVFTAIIVTLAFNLVSWYLGLPTSATHALFSAMIGATLAIGAAGNPFLPKILKLLGIVFASAILGGFLGWVLTRALYQIHLPYSLGAKGARAFNIVLGGLLALFHGAIDTPKSLGLFLLAAGPTADTQRYVFLFAAAISLGMLFGENKILKTLGYKVFRLRAIQGFSSNVCSSAVLGAAASLGLPVSSTQIIVGSILGAGAAKNIRAVRWLVVGDILVSWVFTVPVCVALGFVVAKLLG